MNHPLIREVGAKIYGEYVTVVCRELFHGQKINKGGDGGGQFFLFFECTTNFTHIEFYVKLIL